MFKNEKKQSPWRKPGIVFSLFLTNNPSLTRRALWLTRRALWLTSWVLWLILFFASVVSAAEERVREIFVPEMELGTLIESATDRVLLKRSEFETLSIQAREVRLEQIRQPEKPPTDAVLLSADYETTIVDGRVLIDGILNIDVLTEEKIAIPLPLKNVAILDATLGSVPAALGKPSPAEYPRLILHGKKNYRLALRLTTPLTVDATRQELRFLLPRSPLTSFRLKIPGDVELKSGAAVVKRTVDGSTNFELLLPPEEGETRLLLTLNSHRAKQTRTVIARSVQFAEITEQYRRLHATVSLDVLHQGIETSSFAVPKGFEIAEVRSPLLSRWEVKRGEKPEDGDILNVNFREPITGLTTLNISAIHPTRKLDTTWNFFVLKPLDVAGNSTALGLFVDRELDVKNVETKNLLPIDTPVLKDAIPPSALEEVPGAPTLRLAFAWYSPQGDFDARATFSRPGVKFDVEQSAALILGENEPTLQENFVLKPSTGNLFDVKLNVPKNWKPTKVLDSNGNPLEFSSSASSLDIKLPVAVRPGESFAFDVQAVGTIDGWFGDRNEKSIVFPAFEIKDAENATGFLSVIRGGEEDFEIIPLKSDGLIPLEKFNKENRGLSFRFTSTPFELELRLEKTPPRIKARKFSFYKLEPKLFTTRYEIVCDVEQARTKTLSFRLPLDMPPNPTICGLNGLTVKEYFSKEVEVDGQKFRRWDVVLQKPLSGTLKLAVDFEKPLENPDGNFVLPPLQVENVAWQAELVAVEGDEELDVSIPSENLRSVDAGEISTATDQPGKRLLGVFSPQDDSKPITVQIQRNTPYELATSLIRSVDVTARLADPSGSTVLYGVVYDLQTKAMFVKAKLDEGTELWTATLDGQPIKPQRDDDELLLTVPANLSLESRRIELIYRSMNLRGKDLSFPSLTISGQKIPVLRTNWKVVAPTGFRVDRLGDKTMSRSEIRPALFDLFFGSVDLFSMLTHRGMLRSLTVKESQLGVSSIAVPASPYVFQDFAVLQSEEMPAGTPAFRDQTGKSGTFKSGDDKKISHWETGKAIDEDWSKHSEGRKERYSPPDSSNPQRGRRLQTVQPVSVQLQDEVESGYWTTYSSIGDRDAQNLSVRLANIETERRIFVLSFFVVLFVGLCGLRLSAQRKSATIFGLLIVGTLLVCVPGFERFTPLFNGAVIGTVLGVVPVYFVAGFFNIILRKSRGCKPPDGECTDRLSVSQATRLTGILFVLVAATAFAEESEPNVVLPDSAIIVPYSPDDLALSRLPTAAELTKPEQQLLVPSRHYLEMLELLKTRDKLRKPAGKFVVPFTVSKSEYRTTLPVDEGNDLRLDGSLRIDVFVPEKVVVPLTLENGVFGEMKLDGKPATLRADNKTTASLLVEGVGSHELMFGVRTKIERQGGWRIVAGKLPVAAAAKIFLTPGEGVTDLLTANSLDKKKWGVLPDEKKIVETTTEPNGSFRWQWRSAISEGTVDRSLEVESAIRFDVQEDGYRVDADLRLNMSRGKWEMFRLRLPRDYVITSIDGDNIRGWGVADGAANAPFSQIDVELLKPAEKSEKISVKLWKSAALTAANDFVATEIPKPDVVDAAIHRGRIDLFRSPLLDVRVTETVGVTQTDRREDIAKRAAQDAASNGPLGIEPLQSFRFGSDRFKIAVTSKPVETELSATVRSILKISKHETALETKIEISSPDRPLYEFAVALPKGFELKNVVVPTGGSVSRPVPKTDEPLVVYLSSGIRGKIELFLDGKLEAFGEPLTLTLSPRRGDKKIETLPRFFVLGAKEQRTELVVQTDPSLDVRSENLEGCRSMPLQTVFGWLSNDQQRELARLALVAQSPEFAGKLVLTERQAEVRCETISNVKTTPQSVEETILFDFSIEKAGIRAVEFSLPSWMRDASIEVPMLQRKILSPVSEGEESPVAVRLELQEDVMEQLRVLVRADRKLQAETDYHVSVPTIGTGRTGRQYIVMENDRRSLDEMVVDKTKLVGLRPLSRQQKEWTFLASLLGNGATEAYLGEAPGGNLTFRMKKRETLKLSDARIDLAETRLVVGENGVYLAEQIYRIDNKVEQYLDLRLPPRATLWGVRFLTAEEWARKENGEKNDFGRPVKACLIPESELKATELKTPEYRLNGGNFVRIPLVKTESGDLDYVIRIVYAGELQPPTDFSKIDFPFLAVLNVPVGRSLVRLHLPDNFRYKFDGKMQFVEGIRIEETRRLAESDYLQRQNDRLQQAAESGNVFSKNRAKLNLQGVSQFGRPGQTAQMGRPLIDPIAGPISGSGEIVKDGGGTLQLRGTAMQMMVPPKIVIQEEEEESLSNSVALGKQFEIQQNKAASNVVANNDLNFSGQGGAIYTGIAVNDGNVQFQSGFLEQKGLANRQAAPIPNEKAPPVLNRLSVKSDENYYSGQTKAVEGKPEPQQQRTVDFSGGTVLLGGVSQVPQRQSGIVDSKNAEEKTDKRSGFYGDGLAGSGGAIISNETGRKDQPEIAKAKQEGFAHAMREVDVAAIPQVFSGQTTLPQGGMGGGFGSAKVPQQKEFVGEPTNAERSYIPVPQSSVGVGGAIGGGRELAVVGGLAPATPYPTSAPVPVAPTAVDAPAPVSAITDRSSLEDRSSSDDRGSLKEKKELATRTASLDIEIPYTGREFLFTTPQGSLELSARCFSVETQRRWLTALTALLGIGVVYGIYRLCVLVGRRIMFDRRTHRNVAGLVTLLGCLALPLSFGVFLLSMVAAAVLWTTLLKRKMV